MNIESDFWRGKCVLVTGHTGFMGGWLTVLLNELGARVIGYALAPSTDPSFFDTVRLRELLDVDIYADIRDRSKLGKLIREQAPQIIFHLAAQPLVLEAFRRPVDTFDVNVMGTVNLLEATRDVTSIRSIVVVTSDKVYENLEWEWDYRENDRLGGREPYGVSKACAELVVEAYRQSFLSATDVGVATVRAGNVIGGGDWATDRLLPDIVRAFSVGTALTVRNPAATRPWQHVLEPLRGCLALAQSLFVDPGRFSGGWNFGPAGEDQKSVCWIVDRCAELWGENAQWRIEASKHSYEAQHLRLTCSKAELRLGWKPHWRIETALAHTLNWYRAMIAGHDMLEETRAQVHSMLSGTTAFSAASAMLHVRSAK